MKFNPIKGLAFFLSIYTGVAIYFEPTSSLFLHVGSILGTGLGLYFIFSSLTQKKKNIWTTLITLLILLLLLHPPLETGDIWYGIFAAVFAICYKFFGEYKGIPFINPVISPLLLLLFLSFFIPALDAPFVSWWGASFQGYLSLSLLFSWILLGMYRCKKWWSFGSFFFLFFTLGLMKGMSFLQFAFSDATLYFFASIMLIEPKTSPFKRNNQIIYGSIVAILYHLLLFYHIPSFQLCALAVANLYSFFVFFIQQKR